MFQSPDTDPLIAQARIAKIHGQIDASRALLDQALQIDPENALALSALADLALERRERDDAMRYAERALAREPNCAPAWYQYARALWLAARREQAVDAARRAADIQPANVHHQIQRAQLCAWMGYRQEARAALAPILENGTIGADLRAAAISATGELAIAEGRFADADAPLRTALRLNPHLLATRMMLGMNQMRLGDFSQGWANYAAREHIRQLNPDRLPRLPGKPWAGEALDGRAIVIVDDQGQGDSIQFARFLPLLKTAGAREVTLRTFPSLVRLFRASLPGISITDALPDDSEADYHSSSTVLMHRLNVTLETIPVFRPYMVAPDGTAIRLPSGRQPEVGLAWSGDINHMRDHLRSIPADQFLALADSPGLGFHSLQPTIRPDDVAAVTGQRNMGLAVEQATDFADTAALIAKLDLVIAVDTGVAHLAAAMGKPVWLMLHVAADWRWLTDRADTPWYPTMRLFRVRPDEWGNGDFGWRPVIQRVAAALRQHFDLT
jgi:tetratricopeptide (TPR) repeat protein